MKTFAKLAVSLAALALAPLPAMAQQAASHVTLSGDVKAVKVVTDADGSERTELVAPGTIVPGDRLIFGTDYANNGSEAVTATSLSKTTLYAKIAANELRAVRVGGRTVIPAESLHALIHGEG